MKSWAGRLSLSPRSDLQTDDARLRRIAWQLAALTSALLFVLVIAMSAAVYLQTRDALLQPLRQGLTNRAAGEQADLVGEGNPPPQSGGHRPSQNPGPGPGNPGPGPGEPSEPGQEDLTGGIFLTVLNGHHHIVHSTAHGPTGANGLRIPDPSAIRQVIHSRRPFFTNVQYDGETYLVYTTPAIRPGSHSLAGVVQTLISESGYQADISALIKILLVVGLLGLGATLGITGFVVQRALTPIRLSLQRQRDFVADAAHELRTPLTIIRSSAEMAVGSEDSEEQQRAELTLRETSHLTRLVNDLSFLARADSGALEFKQEPFDLQALVSETIADIAILAEERGISMVGDFGQAVTLMSDPDRLRQLLLILVDNALKHTPDGGTVRVHLRVSPPACHSDGS